MTDKQIIINGVDVGWCKNYNEANSKDCETLYICAENPNCYYKQLKAKEQECERLKRDYFKQNEWLQEQKKELDQLKAENDELRQFLSKEPLAIQALQKSYESYQKSTKVFSDWVKDYKQLITEIKELLKDICIEECCFDWNKTNKKHCGDCDCRFMQLLEKISECEVEND